MASEILKNPQNPAKILINHQKIKFSISLMSAATLLGSFISLHACFSIQIVVVVPEDLAAGREDLVAGQEDLVAGLEAGHVHQQMIADLGSVTPSTANV